MAARQKFTPEEIAQIRARSRITPTGKTERATAYPFEHRPLMSETTSEGRAVNDEIRRHECKPRAKEFPKELVRTALRATDVLAPAALENLVVTITEMHLNKATPEQIAEATGIPVQVVRTEVAKLPEARMVGMKQAPELAVKVVEAHLNVQKSLLSTVNMAEDVLRMMKTEIDESFSGRNDVLDAEDDEEDMPGAEKAKKKGKKRGISNFKTDSFWNGIKAVREMYDLSAKMQGLIAPAVNKTIQQNNIQVNNNGPLFDSTDLNRLADQMLREKGINVEPFIDV